MTNQGARIPSVFYRTGPMPCPYLMGRIEQNLFTELRGPGARDLHDQLAHAGFRRSHRIAYRPACPGCNACVPVRIVVDGFRPTRSQRRILARNRDLRTVIAEPAATAEQFDLFVSYQRDRHPGGEMAVMSFTDYRAMVEESAVETHVVEFRDPGDRLIALCLMDTLSEALSAVYSFFDPEVNGRSLGTHMILWLIQRAAAKSLRHVYLGYWIAECAKMAYKTRFAPLQALGPNGWRPLAAQENLAADGHDLVPTRAETRP
ncbi:MAG: arginyltransferase [Alphaproteobacteria bacterium]